MKISPALAALVALAAASCATAQSATWTGCTVAVNGSVFFDLRAGAGDKTVEPPGDYKYLLNLCASVEGTSDPCTAGATHNCQFVKADGLPFRKVASTTVTPIPTVDANGRLVVTYGGGDLCPSFGNVPRQAVVTFICDPNQLGVPVYVREDACVHSYTWTGSLGCAKAALSPPAPDLPVFDDGGWEIFANMSTPRGYHAAALLQDGRVLVAGGRTVGNTQVKSSELLDVGAKQWTATGAMEMERVFLTLTVLNNGSVLAVGGVPNTGADLANLPVAETYNPTTGTWARAGAVTPHRFGHSATRLPNGYVLVAGGVVVNTVADLNVTQIYNPDINSWSPARPLNRARFGHVAVLLADGSVLVAGGFVNVNNATDAISTVEIFSLTAGNWTVVGSLKVARGDARVQALPNGGALIVGGATRLPGGSSLVSTGTCELFSASTRMWTLLSELRVARSSFSLVFAQGRYLYAIGGVAYGTAEAIESVEVFDLKPLSENNLAQAGWTFSSSTMLGPRYGLTATVTSSNEIIAVGGFDDTQTAVPTTERASVPSYGLRVGAIVVLVLIIIVVVVLVVLLIVYRKRICGSKSYDKESTPLVSRKV
eukprot:Unigene3286_Nuclearia_a/m.10075 Unigene3286_Nuclearia_a/g.10075  ORF Unigene3286_Nuclearia_a/g.10075 Unigene3286_Nuclearia_a/m.10075 type:complete len:598 (-) Unigene3286_Nuclearia_a:68-1861(-)